MTGPAPPVRSPTGTCLECGMADPPPSMTCTRGRDHRVGGTSGCPACLRLTVACAARPCSAARPGQARRGAVRYYEDNSPELARARAAAAAWRGNNPVGASEVLLAEIGCQFHPAHGAVLRALQFAASRRQARVITGAAGNAAPARGPA